MGISLQHLTETGGVGVSHSSLRYDRNAETGSWWEVWVSDQTPHKHAVRPRRSVPRIVTNARLVDGYILAITNLHEG